MENKNIYSLTDYIIKSDFPKTFSPIEIFNIWTEKNNITVSEWSEAIWFINFIKSLLTADKRVLEEAQKIDKRFLK